MRNCKTCEYSVFDETWGEYKCKERKLRIYNLERSKECEFYSEKKAKKEDKHDLPEMR